MTQETMTLSDLVDLAPDSLGGGASEWEEYLANVEPLDPEELPGKILIGSGFYGADILDGVHRTAGMAVWAEDAEIDPEEIDVPVTVLNRKETAEWIRDNGGT